MKMKILILGSQGFIGKSLIQRLLYSDLFHKSIKIIGVDCNTIHDDKYTHYNMDCSVQKEELFNLINKELPDVIINSAAMVGVDTVKFNSMYVGYNNFNISYNLCYSLQKCRLTKKKYQPLIVFFSSSEVYGNTTNASVNNDIYELFPKTERSSYALSKLLEENLYNNLRKQYKNVKILRLFNIVGELQTTNFVIPKMLSDIVHGRTVNITPTYRCFCYVDFLTSSLEKLMYWHDREKKNQYPDITNFTSFDKNNYISMLDLYEICKEVTNMESDVELMEVSPSDIIYRKSELPKIAPKYLDMKQDINILEIVKRIYDNKKF